MSQQFISESCSWFHRQQNYPYAFIMQSLSGTGLNRLGSFQQCHKDPTLLYSLFQYQLTQSSPTFYTGLCYSRNCTANDLMYIAKSVNQYIPLPFVRYRIFEPITQTEFWNSYSIAIITIISIILTITIIATILKLCNKLSKSYRQKSKITLFSIPSLFYFMFNKSKNHQRIKIIAGLRAFAFLGMTIYNLNYYLIGIPSLPQPSHISSYIQIFYYSFDLWLLVSGFYLSFELSKNWNKDQSKKNLTLTIIRKIIKYLILQIITILFINALVYSVSVGPLWTLSYNYFQDHCHLFNIFGECNYWLWIFQVEMFMHIIGGLCFILWHTKFKWNQYVYYGVNLIFCILGFVVAVVFANEDEQQKQGLEQDIDRCPLVTGIAYLIGFNLALKYFSFRGDRNKQKMLLIRIAKHKINRILASLLSTSLLTLIFLYFVYMQENSGIGHKILVQLFHIIIPICFVLLILPEMIGFQNLWGALFKDRFMSIVSRLSFISYSLYYGLCMIVVNILCQDIYVNLSKLICIWVCTIGVSLILGLLVCGLIQIPLYRLMHNIFGRTNSKSYIQFY